MKMVITFIKLNKFDEVMLALHKIEGLAAAVLLAGNEFSMPSVYGIWGKQRSELTKQSPTNCLASGGQTAFLLDAQKDAFPAKLFPQDFVLLAEISYNFLLLLAHPSSNGHGK